MTRGLRGYRPGHPYLAGAPLLIAHRGSTLLAPENTLEAFQRAVEWWGTDVLELDVHPSRDGEAVVIHDATVDRTTGGSGRVAEMALEQLQSLDAGFRFRSAGGDRPFRGTGVRIPTLREVFDRCPGVRLNVEIKDGRVRERVAEVVASAGAEGRTLIAASRPQDALRRRGSRLATSASLRELRTFYLSYRLRLASWYHPRVDAFQLPEEHKRRQVLSPGLIRAAHALNVAVHVWTVNDPVAMRRLLRWGVDGVVTDRPDLLATVLHEEIGRPLPPGAPHGAC
ncbi:MAG: glycerophosphodiester phosphodiesterase [Longimicrobiaceae bacterium]